MRKYIFCSTFFVYFFVLLFLPEIGIASSVYLSPSSGTFFTGSTFNVSILLDTKGKSINAIQTFLSFPPDKLEVVSPSTGSSVVNVWTAPPKFNNTLGTVDLEGGIPGGIITSQGILTTITFRVKSVGEAILKFLDKSRVFLNDGLATEDLGYTGNAIYSLKLPPPLGPVVISSSHSNQSIWYRNREATLNFSNAFPIGGYSYVLNKDPVTTPDNISEGTKTSVVYRNLTDGVHYFHIKALRDGIWGGVSHFTIHVDSTPPDSFSIEILPSARTISTRPVIQFSSTDTDSGIDRYEVKLEPLSVLAVHQNSNESSFFIESISPYVSFPLQLGSYDVVVRAYDKADNYTEVTKRLVVTTPIFQFISDKGVVADDSFIIPWLLFWFIFIVLLLVVVFVAYKVLHYHHAIHIEHKEKKLPEDVLIKLEELKKYQEKYGIKTLIILFALLSLFSLRSVEAATKELTSPLITNISEDISNNDIFYVGGKTDVANQVVILYLQNLLTGETISENIESDHNGDWFYRHGTFLSSGNYLLWTQGKIGEEFSPPGPEKKITVKQTAIVFGSNRLSYEAVYLFFIVLLLLVLLALVSLIIFHMHHARKKHREFEKAVREAEESIRRGFAVIKRDIESELSIVGKAQLPDSLSSLEKEKETELLRDLNDISKHITKEIWEINQDNKDSI